jgi:hypothetical protein
MQHRRGRTGREREADCRHQLVNADVLVAAGIDRGTDSKGCAAQGDVDASDELADRHAPIAVAITAAQYGLNRDGCGNCKREKPYCDNQPSESHDRPYGADPDIVNAW